MIGDEVPAVSVNLMKLHLVDPTNIKINAVKAKTEVRRKRRALLGWQKQKSVTLKIRDNEQ